MPEWEIKNFIEFLSIFVSFPAVFGLVISSIYEKFYLDKKLEN